MRLRIYKHKPKSQYINGIYARPTPINSVLRAVFSEYVVAGRIVCRYFHGMYIFLCLTLETILISILYTGLDSPVSSLPIWSGLVQSEIYALKHGPALVFIIDIKDIVPFQSVSIIVLFLCLGPGFNLILLI